MTHSRVTIQITPQSLPSTPCWMAEVAAFAQVFCHTGLLQTIQEQVRFTRARFGQYELIDFVVVLLGYALSGEPTLQTFYERLSPFAEAFMALFGRKLLPHRSTLSRFLAALDEPTVEALRTLFQKDLLARPPLPSPGELCDRTGESWLVMDVDGTRMPARQRALPHGETLPLPHRRFDAVCAPGYMGRKRGEVVRTRTVVVQAHTHQFLATFGGPGNGDYRGELLRAIQTISTYASSLAFPLPRVLLRLDGLYGDGTVLLDVVAADLAVIARSRDYGLLALEAVKQVLARPPAHVSTNAASGMSRALYDCPAVPLTPTGPRVRLLVASHATTSSAPPVGVQRDGSVYELFVTTLASPAFLACDVLDLYLHRGSFETLLADEDSEQDSDRWYSHTPWGQEFGQILAQWVWNLRLELGQKLSPCELQITEFAKALPDAPPLSSEPTAAVEAVAAEQSPSPVEYGPPQWARPSFTGGFAGSAFTLQADGTLRCPADRPLYPQERRRERNGSLRVLYAARIGHCRSCALREQCQESRESVKPRRVSAVFWPRPPVLPEASAPLPASAQALPLFAMLWKDWPRCGIRRAWLKLIRSETVGLRTGPPAAPVAPPPPVAVTRAQRAHWRLSWAQRLARKARSPDASALTVTLHGLPATFAQSFGFDLLPNA
jgi:hypothetical protein